MPISFLLQGLGLYRKVLFLQSGEFLRCRLGKSLLTG